MDKMLFAEMVGGGLGSAVIPVTLIYPIAALLISRSKGLGVNVLGLFSAYLLHIILYVLWFFFLSIITPGGLSPNRYFGMMNTGGWGVAIVASLIVCFFLRSRKG